MAAFDATGAYISFAAVIDYYIAWGFRDCRYDFADKKAAASFCRLSRWRLCAAIIGRHTFLGFGEWQHIAADDTNIALPRRHISQIL